eukprot:CAMPEP_0113943082 /NCGR_PEP_ID=MMETSP1339-20121228/19169_1 /TAXON_ID=94617 /ORGANISM="Fibrocapsa japonica" /LENGTH=218 /DNA_ID=CAMNT_0000947847 /DNA_START=118 /DNA_END=774 /DNA_ORIENTATION=- /assembly_acc=CAM_ASM_000762
MNLFRLAGDLSHAASIIILLQRLRTSKSALGISLKTQELFLIVFLCRYLDLFTTFISLYNSVMKVLYISSTSYIIYMMRMLPTYKATYDKDQDSFLHIYFAVVPCLVLALITNLVQGFDFTEMLWIFSIYLEATAIIPQLVVLQRYREVENLTGNYVFLLGCYRALYIMNWVYRAYHEAHYRHSYVAYAAGVVQTALYVDFFYYYALSKAKGGTLIVK